MKSFRRLAIIILLTELALLLLADALLLSFRRSDRTPIDVREFVAGEAAEHPYYVEEAGGVLYRVEYEADGLSARSLAVFNVVCFCFIGLTVFVLVYLGKKIVSPFERMASLPETLAKGEPAVPLREQKSRYFGRFLWGMDLLRDPAL